MHPKHLFTLALSAFTSVASASQVITLEDGRTVQLNDDFTWQYVQQPEIQPQAPIASIAAPIVTTPRGAILKIGSNKPSLQLSDSGVDVVLGAAKYQDGYLVLPTAITNQSSQSVIGIELNIELLDVQGKSLVKQETMVWQSIKRMAETYLRPKTSDLGKVIKIKVPKAESYQLIATISQVETR